jgi:hypothetical protein
MPGAVMLVEALQWPKAAANNDYSNSSKKNEQNSLLSSFMMSISGVLV